MYTLTWIEAAVPAELQVRQVYGYIFGTDGRILLQDDEGHYNLSGGKPEEGEGLTETLARETLEESQVVIGSTKYLGYQHVEGAEEFAQVRFTALLDHLLPVAPDPLTGRQYRRLWVPPTLVNELLGWGDSGSRQVAKAVSAAHAMGVSWDGTPLSGADDESRR